MERQKWESLPETAFTFLCSFFMSFNTSLNCYDVLLKRMVPNEHEFHPLKLWARIFNLFSSEWSWGGKYQIKGDIEIRLPVIIKYSVMWFRGVKKLYRPCLLMTHSPGLDNIWFKFVSTSFLSSDLQQEGFSFPSH